MSRIGTRATPAHSPRRATAVAPHADPYILDRRAAAREADALKTELLASYTNHDDRAGITHMTVVDRSSRGLGVRTATAIEPGMTVTINSGDPELAWLRATAVRCVQRDGGFHVGLKLSRGRTAA